ncbi:MAG: hypothetical protein WAK93_22605, partial [Solirubrobacteraceae bacterium]
QTLHWNLNTDGAPSWKPLTFLFTLPYSLVHSAAEYLWVLTSAAGAFAGSVFAARIAYRLTGPSPGRRYAPFLGAIVAGLGVLGIDGYAHQLLIANADPFTATLCLAAIDAHLSKRPRLAFVVLVLISLGRPEAWIFAGLYGIWAWRSVPSSRLLVAVGLVLIPAIWFVVPALTSKSWLTPGNLDSNLPTAIQGNKFTGVSSRFLGLYSWPMEVAALLAVAWAVKLRDRVTLALAGLAILWVAVEVAFALHGYSAVARYLFEPAAVMVVLAGSGVGRLLAWAPDRGRVVSAVVEAAVVVAFLAALYPYINDNLSSTHQQVLAERKFARQLDRLSDVVAKVGGPAKILSCGQPATLLQFQSTVAWEVGLNVGNVSFRPGRSIGRKIPVVVLKPHDLGWQVRTYNIPHAKAARCRQMRTDSAFG